MDICLNFHQPSQFDNMSRSQSDKVAKRLMKDLHHYGVDLSFDIAFEMVRKRGWTKRAADGTDTKPYIHPTAVKVAEVAPTIILTTNNDGQTSSVVLDILEETRLRMAAKYNK